MNTDKKPLEPAPEPEPDKIAQPAEEIAAPAALSMEDRLAVLEAQVKALAEAIGTHNHAVGPELIDMIAEEGKKLTLHHLKRQLGAHIAHYLLDGDPA